MMDLFIFDMGGVLAGNCDIAPEAALRLGLPVDRFRELARPGLDACMAGRMGTGEFWDRFRADSGLAAAEDYWATLFRPVPDPEMERLARALKPFGRVVCGTNTLDVHYDILRDRGFYDPFDAVYASHLLGICKPDPGFWLRILEAEGREADRAFFVDDAEENVRAARGLGIRSHEFRDAASLVRDLGEAGISIGSAEGRP